MGQEAVDADERIVFGFPALRFLFGGADDEGKALQELDILVAPPEAPRQRPGLRDQFGRDTRIRRGNELALGVGRGEPPPGGRGPAWNKNGVRCGEGEGKCGPSTR